MPTASTKEKVDKLVATTDKRDLAATVVNLANQEPWYRSRVTWGAIVAIAIPLLGAIGVSTDVLDPEELTAIGMAAGAVVGGIITIWGRYGAKKPLGM